MSLLSGRHGRRIIFWLSLLLLAVAAFGCAAAKTAPVVPAIAAKPVIPPLIPRQVLFGNPDRAGVQLSADGQKISFLAPVDGVLNVWVGPADDFTTAKPVTSDKKRGIRNYFWAYTNEHVLYLQDKDGDENWRVHVVDLRDGSDRDLTPYPGVRADIQAVSPKFPTSILIALNNRVPEYHDLYRVDLLTGELSLAMQNPGFADFVTDDDYRIRFADRITPDGGLEYLKLADDGQWQPYLQIGADDAMTTHLVGFDKTTAGIYLLDSRQRDTAALYWQNVASGERKLLAEDPRADISDALVHPTEKTVQAVAANFERKHWRTLDQAIAPDLEYLRGLDDGDVEVTDRTVDDARWIVAYVKDDGPVRYYLYDHRARRAKFLFTNLQALEHLPLVKMHPVSIPARDGLSLVSYLTLPQESDPDGDARPAAPLPLVLYVHGGPWSRTSWGLNSMHQWLANRGYAVLDVNFRGSTGFGKNFINAGNKEWGGKMQTDLMDAVAWAVQAGIADPAKVAIMGGSYGGYATLAGMTLTPEAFACGVDIVGPSNLETLLESIPPYWKPMLDVFYTRVGDPRTDEGVLFLASRSPLTHADQIRRPLLIGQGANDPRVKQAESDQIVKAMKLSNIPVTYVLYSDEGHGFARPENRLSFFAVTELFLAGCLGGRAEPIGKDFAGSSIAVPEGAAQVPGLIEGLNPPGGGN
ncbi:MAG: S9 family peptidase [Myxococcales bacterium]|nr:S9 family peptidase [Myxococcales bacterium]